ncbi:hypothetical protein [Herbidospora daliensis]|uniref:hypothetical protein n=1 Tax=Herbidospora daliensis TaxID=295585 RepID=UPI0012F8D864|nr:hypothetical protein [Herbidospora daliensis]
MQNPEKRPLRRGDIQNFEFPAGPSTDFGQAVSTPAARVHLLLADDGAGQGGGELDDALDALGAAYTENGQVVWEAPDSLDPHLAEHLHRSVAALNGLIADGALEVDSSGAIKPIGG